MSASAQKKKRYKTKTTLRIKIRRSLIAQKTKCIRSLRTDQKNKLIKELKKIE